MRWVGEMMVFGEHQADRITDRGHADEGRGQWVGELLAAVKTLGPQLQDGAFASDEQGRLVDRTVDLLRSADLWRMRLCRELGGLELSMVDQIEVLAALAAEDASAAWCTMVANDAVAMLGATMPDEAVSRMFASGIPNCSIVAAPGGVATPVPGGYRVTGTWRLASAIRHAEWVHATALVERDPSRVLPLAIPARDVEILNTWDVVGLAGTGSNDFSLTDYFIPVELAGREHDPYGQVRGTRRYDLVDIEHIESYEHLAFAIGIARRALRELRQVLAKQPSARNVADRELVQEEFGRSVLRLQAIEALALSLYARIDAAALGREQAWFDGERHLPRTLAAQASELALECVQLAFRRSGIAALHRPNIYEKLMRDMSVAATHVAVDDSAFSTYAQNLIETGCTLEYSAIAPLTAMAA